MDKRYTERSKFSHLWTFTGALRGEGKLPADIECLDLCCDIREVVSRK